MSIIGAHVVLYTTQPDALRATLRDVFGFQHVDAGDGWLIFALPPSELGVHPAEGPTSSSSGVRHQLTFMCDNIATTVRDLRAKGIGITGEPKDEGWGVTVMMNLPGGVDVMLYQPRHPTAVAFTVAEELR
jgi:catechol 2,3-dioxygenase-like lactoylglutathione lyase family enzyme